jgi:chemotaxis signal transduction protein/CheY-like chemotaxis protein/ABC-type nitrate/sulfonate/bicarbonate transport system substrate-binding protein
MSFDPKMKILLVEDASSMRKMEKKVLNSLELNNVVEAEDGNAAIELLNKDKEIQLIISDWNMPNMDGYDLLLWVRKNEDLKKLPFIMATGRGEKKEVAKASEAGVSSFIAKPFNAEELREKIEVALGLRNPEAEAAVEKNKVQVTASGKVKLTVAHIQITDHLALGVLKHLIQTGELKPKFFELETKCLPTWNAIQKALESGTVSGAFVLAPLAMEIYNYGVPLKLLLFAHKNGSICVRNKKGGEFKEPQINFFRNKSFYLPHFMSIHHMLAHMFFKSIGLTPGTPGNAGVNFNFEIVAPIKMPEFLESNQDCAGYIVAEPLGTKAIAGGIADLQFLTSELWEGHPCCVFAVQEELVSDHAEAMQELTEMLVYAGKFIDQKPALAAEIAVTFLDPDKSLGLKVPLLKNVLTEPKGIKTGDLYPVKADLDRIQRYMHNEMGIGNIIDLDKFVDLRFADKACPPSSKRILSKIDENIIEKSNYLLTRGSSGDKDNLEKSLLYLEGKYLTFCLNSNYYGVDILKIIEIIRLIPITLVPNVPHYVKGVINLRGKVVPVVDLRLKLNMSKAEYDKSSRIIVIEINNNAEKYQVGVIVDQVSEVYDVAAKDIESLPEHSTGLDAGYILALVKSESSIKILLDIDNILEPLNKAAKREN